jgi:hypothetical protein
LRPTADTPSKEQTFALLEDWAPKLRSCILHPVGRRHAGDRKEPVQVAHRLIGERFVRREVRVGPVDPVSTTAQTMSRP